MDNATSNLFSIGKLIHEEGVINAGLIINPSSEILQGHFPGRPVVPGACMLQAVKEVLEKALGLTLRLQKATQLKFVNMIDPANTQKADLALSYKTGEGCSINVTGSLSDAEIVFFKFQGSFIIA